VRLIVSGIDQKRESSNRRVLDLNLLRRGYDFLVTTRNNRASGREASSRFAGKCRKIGAKYTE
jgi:hypothetical protein